MQKPTPNSWFPYRIARPAARLRLFCFPYAGGNAGFFRSWAEQFPPEIEVVPVQLPGRERRISEPAFTNLSDLLDALVPAITPALDRPFAFFGHSMGAIISFELALRLRSLSAKYRPVRLFLSAQRAPQLPLPHDSIYALPDEDFLAEVRKLNGTDEEVWQNQEMVQLLLPLLRADFTLYEQYAYHPQAPLDMPLTLFGGLSDADATKPMLEAWNEQTTASARVRCFPGDHFYLHSARNLLLTIMAQELLKDLATVALRR